MYYLKGQKHFNDCGVACVATILGLYDIEYNYKKIGEIHTFLDILVALRSFNIECEAYHLEQINSFPCIVQIKQLKHYHFIVLYEENGNKFLYYSPDKLMIHKISKKKFYKRYTSKCIKIITKKDFCSYKINLKSIPFSIKLIIFNIFLLFLIISLLNI